MRFILLGILNSQVEAAGGGSYELISTTLISTNTSSVTFSNLDTLDYRHLQFRIAVRNSFTGFAGIRNVNVRLNGDSGTNYRGHILEGNGSAVQSNDTGATTALRIQSVAPDNDTTANVFGVLVADILDYKSPNKNTTMRALSGNALSGNNRITLTSSFWNNTAAVTTMEVSFDTFNAVAGSRISLYGIKG